MKKVPLFRKFIKNTAFFVFIIILFFQVDVGSVSRDFVRFQVAKGLFKKGITYYNNLQYLAAAEFFRKAVKEYPEYYTARDFLARSFMLAGFSDEALKEWEILSNISPNNVAVQNKIDNIKYQGIIPEKTFRYSELILNKTYKSVDFKRFGFDKPTDLSVDKEKNLYITSFSSGKLIKIDPNGNGVSITQPSFSGKLYGIDNFKDKIAVSDFKNDTIYILNTSGTKLNKFGGQGSGPGKFHGPEGLCFDEKGYIYIVDSGNHRVQKFDINGRFILKFGSKGKYEGQLSNPTDVVFRKGMLYVTDTGNRRIACYDDSGNFIENLFIKELLSPRGISRLDDTLMISDEKSGLLFYKLYDKDVNWFNRFGGDNGRFSMLISSTFDRDGYLYCLDYNLSSVFIFSPMMKRYSNLILEITSVDINKFPIVALYINVRNRDGSPVYGLDSNNFMIVEDNAQINRVDVNYLKKLPNSSSMVLCVDRSEKNRDYHNEMPWVSDFILKKMKTNDRIKVVNFSNNYWEGNPFDWSRRRTLRSVRKREYGKGKRIGKALYNAISDLIPKLNRRGVILITDGSVSEDSFQSYRPENIVNYARAHYVPIYIISFKKPDTILENIAMETGGAVYRPNQLNKLRKIYDKINNSEEYRYILLYTTFKMPSFKGWWSDVKIKVDYKGQKGTEWGGYFVP